MKLKNNSYLNGKVIRVMWSHPDPSARKSGRGNVFVKVYLQLWYEIVKSLSGSLSLEVNSNGKFLVFNTVAELSWIHR